MKMMKKVLAMLLATAMILTGLYIVPGEAAEVKATESGTGTGNTTVNTDMLNVKFQTAQTPITDESDANNGKYVMRFIASVDSLDYSAVGFEVTSTEGTAGYNDSVVFERIVSEDANVSYEFSPKVVDTSSEYFVTARMYATPGVNYTIRAYVVSLDGTTTTYGGYRCVSAEDGLNGVTTTNVSFEETTADTYTTGTTYDITSSADGTQATVFEKNGTTVHARVNVAPSALPSATKFTFGSDETTIYRNLYTTHVPAEGTTPVADKTWYEVYGSSEDAYIIATGADLYGLAAIVDENEQLFASKTIYVVSDIAINSTGTKTYEWNPIGTASILYKGNFDGQMHEISGLHVSAATGVGLFAATDAGTISNIKIADSTFVGTDTGTAYVGSLAGYVGGHLDTVYVGSDVTVTSAGQETGGIAGRLTGNRAHTITNCQFDGTVTGSNDYIGGIFGRIVLGQTTMSNCLNMGSISSTEVYVSTDTVAWCGGLIGGVHTINTSLTVSLELSDSLNIGTVSTLDGVDGGVAAIIGRARNTTTLTNVYFEEGKVSCGDETPSTSNATAGCGSFSTYNNTVNGIAKERTQAQLTGALARYNTGFDYYTSAEDDGVWVAQDNATPVLKSFADEKTYYTEDVTMTADTSWYDADDVKTSYYISTAAELKGLSELAITQAFKGTTFTLTADICYNLGDADTFETTQPKNIWTPIGRNTDIGTVFAGSFDGQNHSISGLYMITGEAHLGLFGYVSTTGQISNIQLENSLLKSIDREYTQIGSIVGLLGGGTVKDCYSNVTLASDGRWIGGIVGRANSTSSIQNCTYEGNLKGTHQYVGGILGVSVGAQTTISNCIFGGKITASNIYVGGILAAGEGTQTTISNCVFRGEITANEKYVGGILGQCKAGVTTTIQNCISEGMLTTTWTDTDWAHAGGIAGVSYGVLNISNVLNSTEINAAVMQNESTSKLEARTVGAIVGRYTDTGTGTITNAYYTPECFSLGLGISTNTAGTDTTTGAKIVDSFFVKVPENYLKGENAFRFTDLDFTNNWVAIENELPGLKVFSEGIDLTNAQASDTAWYNEDDDTYTISTVAQFFGLAKKSLETNFEGKTINLAADIAVNGGEASKDVEWMPIGMNKGFKGVFNGNMKTISGIYVDAAKTNAGLFATVSGENCEIKNFSLINSYFTTTKIAESVDTTGKGNWSGGDVRIGSIAGSGNATFENIYSSATVYLPKHRYAGGLVGIVGNNTTSTFSKCQYAGNLTLLQYGGGLVGFTEGTSSITMTNCLSTATIYGVMHNIGGLCGNIEANRSIEMSYCVSDLTSMSVPNEFCAGSVISRIIGTGTGTINNVYTTNNIARRTDGKLPDQVWNGIGTSSGTLTEGSVAPIVIDSTTAYNLDTSIWTIGTDNVPYLTQFAQ